MVDYSVDMVEQMKICTLMQHVRHLDPTRMPVERSLEMATINAATALGLANEIGSLEPGKRADIAMFDLHKPYVGVLHRPLSSFVTAGKGSDVRVAWSMARSSPRWRFQTLRRAAAAGRRGGENRQRDRRQGRPQPPAYAGVAPVNTAPA